MRQILKNRKKIVIKIGSSLLANANGKMDSKSYRKIAGEVHSLIKQGYWVVLVSSGAIAAGLDKFNLNKVPKQIHQKQALAAAGQISMMREYEIAFAKCDLPVGQILLNRDDLADRERFLNARHTIAELLKMKAVPIINENDSVAVDEIKIGDNDNLSALVTNLVEADLLIILTDIDGLYTADPRLDKNAQRISVLNELNDTAFSFASGTLRVGSTGGMQTKLQAAMKACHYGVPTLLASGRQKDVLAKLLKGEDLGTLILPKSGNEKVGARKHWIAYMQKASGVLWVDEGAKMVLTGKGKSLLPSGIKKVDGQFSIGDVVDIAVENGSVFARGLASYSSQEIAQIVGCKSREIEIKLGYKYADEVIHRDDLVLL